MKIIHKKEEGKFISTVDKQESILYYILDENIMNIITVQVPEKQRKKGLAEKLTLYVFKYAKKNKLKIIPTCPYVRITFLSKHKEFKDLIVNK